MAMQFDGNCFKLAKWQTQKLNIFVGPWKYVEEFFEVYKLIYGVQTSVESYRKALSLLCVWKARRSHLCPAYVLATQVLLDIVIKDVTSAAGDFMTHQNLQALYAHAIVLFFNFMSSTVQEHKMRTMYETARMLSINSIVVDIRHLCSHGQILPELDMLRYVSKYCLRWISAHYWQPLSISMHNVSVMNLQTSTQSELEHKIKLLLSVYDTALLVLVNGALDLLSAREFAKSDNYTLLKQYFECRNCQRLREVPHCVVKDLHELYKNACLLDLKDSASTLYVYSLLQLEHFYKLLAIYNMGGAYASIFDSSQSIFRMLTINGLLEKYFYALIKLCESSVNLDTEKVTGASLWVSVLVNSFMAYNHWSGVSENHAEFLCSSHLKFSDTDFTDVPKPVRALLESLGYNTRYIIVIGYADIEHWDFKVRLTFLEQRLDKINIFTARVIKELLPLTFPSLSETKQKKLLEFINLLHPKNRQIGHETGLIHPIHEFKSLVAKESLFQHKASNNNESDNDAYDDMHPDMWALAAESDVIDWCTTPLGMTPWESHA